MATVKLVIFRVIIMYPAKKDYLIQDVAATTNVRAFMKVKNSCKWKDVDVDDVLYHTDQLASFEVEKK